MMFITTTWCGWCKKLANESFNNPEIRDLLANFVCVIVDGDTSRSVIVNDAAGMVPPCCLPHGSSWRIRATFRPRSLRASLRKLSASARAPEGRSVRAQLNNLRGGTLFPADNRLHGLRRGGDEDGRIRQMIKVDGCQFWTLFDTAAIGTAM